METNPEISNEERLESLLPGYLTGSLSDGERSEVRRALAGDSGALDEALAQSALMLNAAGAHPSIDLLLDLVDESEGTAVAAHQQKDPLLAKQLSEHVERCALCREAIELSRMSPQSRDAAGILERLSDAAASRRAISPAALSPRAEPGFWKRALPLAAGLMALAVVVTWWLADRERGMLQQTIARLHATIDQKAEANERLQQENEALVSNAEDQDRVARRESGESSAGRGTRSSPGAPPPQVWATAELYPRAGVLRSGGDGSVDQEALSHLAIRAAEGSVLVLTLHTDLLFEGEVVAVVRTADGKITATVPRLRRNELGQVPVVVEGDQLPLGRVVIELRRTPSSPVLEEFALVAE